jgi:hydroxyethylthiazole kinase-like uncharacterized protein yjeF
MVILVGGSRHYPGAICLSAHASERAGAGYVKVYTSSAEVSLVQAYRPSLVVFPQSEIVPEDMPATRAEKPCAYVIGPGIAVNEEMQELANSLLENVKAPVVIDGGALSFLESKRSRDICKRRFIEGLVTIITPHKGEAARLASVFQFLETSDEKLATLLSLAFGVVVLLKGPDTSISNGEETYCMDKGTFALAKAGTGDVLSGILGAFLTQGLEAFDACVLATTLHAYAGAKAAENLEPLCVCAEDVIEYFPHAVRYLLQEIK